MVNTFIVAIWAVTGAGFFWPVFPMVGWDRRGDERLERLPLGGAERGTHPPGDGGAEPAGPLGAIILTSDLGAPRCSLHDSIQASCSDISLSSPCISMASGTRTGSNRFSTFRISHVM